MKNSYFSQIGETITLPKGVFYWTDRAKKEATVNATIGSAVGLASEFLENAESLCNKNKITFYIPYIKEMINNINSEEIFPYAPILGVKKLRDLWKDWIIYKAKDEDIRNKITTPIVVNGATNGIYLLLKLFLSAGEYVISADKRWENYDTIIKGCLGLKVENFSMFENGKLNISGIIEKVEKISKLQKKIVLLINFPNNPTGYSPPFDDVDSLKSEIVKLKNKLGLPMIIIFDDAYEGFVYEEKVVNNSIFNQFINLSEDLIPIKVDGLSKEFLLYGGRIAFITFGFNENNVEQMQTLMEDKIGALIRGVFSNSNNTMQNLAIKFLSNREIVLKQRERIINILKERYIKLKGQLKSINSEYAEIDDFNSGFFSFLNLKGIDSFEFAEKLLTKYKVGVVPIKVEGTEVNGIRIAFCGLLGSEIDLFTESLINALNDYK